MKLDAPAGKRKQGAEAYNIAFSCLQISLLNAAPPECLTCPEVLQGIPHARTNSTCTKVCVGGVQAVQDNLLQAGGQRHILNVGHGVVQVHLLP